MSLLANPWVLVGIGAAFVISNAVTGWKAYEHGIETCEGQHAKDKIEAVELRDAARQGAAEAIAQMKPVNTTIRQQAEEVIREVPVYRDCVNDPAVMRNINAALTGRAEPAADGLVPGTHPAH